MWTQKCTLIVQDEFTNWIQSYPMKTQDSSETLSCSQDVLPSSLRPANIYANRSNAFIKVCQDEKWNQTKEISETMSCLRRFLLAGQRPERVFTDSSKESVSECQDLNFSHDMCTPHRQDTNEVAQRAVRTVKEGTAVAPVQSDLLDERWDCATQCYRNLRNVHDRMAVGKTAFVKRY